MEEIDLTKMPREEAVKLAMTLFNFTRSYAEFYVAMARGEVDGDVIEVEEGNE